MNNLIQDLLTTFMAQSALETVAVVCAILYLILVVRENIWCWFFAFVSTALFIYLFHSVALLSESVLNIYYLLMAVYGWMQWRKKDAGESKIQCWPAKVHWSILISCLVLTPVVGYIMSSLGASFPYLDAFVAILSVFATVMVAKKVFENWYYWLLVDTLSIYLFWQKQLYFVAALYVVYIALIFVGIKIWKQRLDTQSSSPHLRQ